MAAIAYLLYISVFIPYQAKTSAYSKLKAKERLELDRRLDIEHYFGAKAEEVSDIKIPIKFVKGNFLKAKKTENID